MRRAFRTPLIVVLLTAALGAGAESAGAATSLENFQVTVSAKDYSKNGVTGQHVKSIKISGAGAKAARPLITCGKRCGRNRLFKGKLKRSKLYRTTVKFTNVNWLVAPGKGFRVNMIPRSKKVQAVYIDMYAPNALNPGFTMGAAGCITRKRKIILCPPGITLPKLNHVLPAPPPTTCPGQPLATTSLAPYLGHNPRGTVDVATGILGNSILVRGWAFDPDEPQTSIQVHAYYDGTPGAGIGSAHLADLRRDDYAIANPGANTNHGFAFQIPNVPAGSHTLNVYGINVGTGENVLHWGGTISSPVENLPAGTPLGIIDDPVAIGCNSAKISGWTLDPDSPTLSNSAHIYPDGWAGDPIKIFGADANIARADVATSQPGAGPTHGFSTTVDGLAPGVHAFFVYGINMTGAGINPLLGVRYVRIP